MAALSFRFAVREDTPLILSFIRALAEYEQMADQVVADEQLLERQLFDLGGAEVLFALEDGQEVGFALFFHNFSTFLGRAGLYLEDLYVLPEHRGKGYGKALLQRLVVVPRLEPAQHRFLSLPGRRAHVRLDGLPSQRRDARSPRRAEINPSHQNSRP